MIYAINFSDKNFENMRRYNTKTAYLFGKADKVIEYSPNDIDKDFFEINKNIFSYKRGFGLWLWKPYFILKTLEEINEGDYLMYCDSGAIYTSEIKNLIKELENSNQSIMVFELPLLERQFTKRETFYLMNSDQFDKNQILASYILLKKCEFSVDFIKEWLFFMQDEKVVSPKIFFNKIKEFEDFVNHREDQSVLSILVRKHNLKVFRDPSDYGDRPWQYASNKCIYRPIIYSNSNYPRVLLSNRKVNPFTYILKSFMKDIFYKFGILNEKKFLSRIINEKNNNI